MRASADNLPDRANPGTKAATDAVWAARGEARMGRVPAFGGARIQLGVEHRRARPCHPWTHGQVGRMSRTLEEAAARRRRDASHDELRAHLQPFPGAGSHARRFKAPRGLTPYGFTCRAWTQEPGRFRTGPSHRSRGVNI